MKNEGRISEEATSSEEVRAKFERRFRSTTDKYKELYGVDSTDPLNFDIVINTSHITLAVQNTIVLAAYNAWRGEEK
jgi:cytidylate kinase